MAEIGFYFDITGVKHGKEETERTSDGVLWNSVLIFRRVTEVNCRELWNANLQFVRIFVFSRVFFFRGEFVFSLRSDRDTSLFAICSAIRHSVEQLAAAQPCSCRQRATKLASLSVTTVDDDAQRALRM